MTFATYCLVVGSGRSDRLVPRHSPVLTIRYAKLPLRGLYRGTNLSELGYIDSDNRCAVVGEVEGKEKPAARQLVFHFLLGFESGVHLGLYGGDFGVEIG